MTMQLNKAHVKSEIKTSTVKLSNGAELFIAESGQGDELVVFLHAVGGDSRSWATQMSSLAALGYKCLALDFRGHGKSKFPGQDTYMEVTVKAFAQDVIALLEQLNYTKAHFVGLSMGGVVALNIFQQKKSIVQSLTLANTWSFNPQAEDKVAFMKDRLSKMSLKESAAELIPALFATGTNKDIIAQAVEIEGTKDKDVFLSSWISMFAYDYRQVVSEIDVPVLLIGGTQDQITPTDPLLTEIHKLLPASQLVNIDGAGHFSNLDKPNEFESILSKHLRRARMSQGQQISPLKAQKIEAGTVAHALMGLLNKRGIRYFFSNSGTDFTPIIDALACYSDDPDFNLEEIVAPHENTAIAMAHGYFLLSGKPQAVMAHVNVGTANMGLGIINANRSHIPMLVLAGKSPWYEQPSNGAQEIEGCRTNFVQWGQDTFDQAAYFREFTKWDYELKGSFNLETVVDRALAISKSQPAGPVYLTLPKEALCEQVDSFTYSETPRQSPTAASEPVQSAIDSAAKAIAAAKKPLIVTAELGRYQGGVEALSNLAMKLAIGVVEFGKHNFFNLPTDHPMHLGFDPAPYITEADLIICIESHVPWIPAITKAPEPLERGKPIIQIGVDPLAGKIPMRSFPADICLAGNPTETLRRICEALAPRQDKSRFAAIEAEHKKIFETAKKEASKDASLPKISKRYISYCLGEIADDKTVIFNEYNLEPTLVPRHLADSWFENSIASGLGWSLGAALGAQLAAPDLTMVATLGDGSYLFNTPLSAHYVAAAYKLPIVIVVFNDSAWSTIKKSYLGTTKNGWAQKKDSFALCNLEVDISFEKLAEATGGIGLTVDKPAELPATLRKAIDISRKDKKHVLVNVVCERDT